MSEYKCIGCGEIKESESRCTCPICGYSMYEQPYDRTEMLRSEVIRFVDSIIHVKSQKSDVVFKEKNKDEKRFPDFDKIQQYVCAANKTEDFLERLLKTTEQIKKHIHEPFHNEYIGKTDNFKAKSDRSKEQLLAVMEELDFEIEINEFAFPNISLEYSETPDAILLAGADELLERLDLLIDKIKRFVKKNSVYGTAYQKKIKKPSLSKENDWASDIKKSIDRIDAVIAKKYVVDILDDGTKELNEMLKVVWDTIFVIMTAHVLRKTCFYSVDEKFGLTESEYLNTLSDILASRFSDIDEYIHSSGFLADKNEDQLFELYNKMLDLDWYGYMKVNKGTVLNSGESEKELEKLIGLSSVKNSIMKIKAFAVSNKDSSDLNLHMCFCGNPGTGKTEVARIIAGILHENGLLPTDKVVETDRSGLVAGYVGQTAIKTTEKIMEAMGGVLFIDEAYSLVQSETKGDYGHEAVAELIKAMEDYRGKFCVILTGYKNPMQEMIAANPGFKSRIQFQLDFPNYSRDELRQIAELMLKNKKYSISKAAIDRILDITDIMRKEPNFANAREIRNILDQVIMCQSLRCVGTDDRSLEIIDVNTYIKDNHISLPTSGEGIVKKILSAEEELDNLIGLSAVKRMIKKIKAYAKRNKDDSDFNLHMCFYGNPGTGKTEVARILSRILYEAGILPEAKLTETDSHGLIGKYVGETAPKTLAKVNDSMGGVLFIDEAYSLTQTTGADGKSVGYGDEAIAVLLKEMEDKRGQFCVILAGYKDEMRSMLGSNPGLESRIQFSLDFPDYTRDELSEIALSFLNDKKYVIDDNSLALALDITEFYRNRPNFANARTVRNILDQVIMNQNLRTEDEPNNQIIKSDVEDYIEDENIDLSSTSNGKRKIGF